MSNFSFSTKFYVLQRRDSKQKPIYCRVTVNRKKAEFNLHKLITGIISLRDVQRIRFGSNLGGNQESVDQAMFGMLSIDQVMKHEPRTVSPETTIKAVAEKLAV
ncbi:MAG: CBS domain-containing protein [Parvicellaceae bacterium]|jgi:CBS domain-containing protein